MMENFRRFEAGPDPFGRTWHVEFRWLQNAITIRHADAIDLSFVLHQGEDAEEKVISIPMPSLLELSHRGNRPITDPWVMKLAAVHLKHMIETDVDMDKILVTMSAEDLSRANTTLDEWQAARPMHG